MVTVNCITNSNEAVSHCQHRSRLAVPHSLAPTNQKQCCRSRINQNDYDGADRDSRAEHDVWFVGYGSCVTASGWLARMKEVIGDLISPTVAGDDAHTPYGRCMAVVLHAAVPGDGLDSVPFLLNSPKRARLTSSVG